MILASSHVGSPTNGSGRIGFSDRRCQPVRFSFRRELRMYLRENKETITSWQATSSRDVSIRRPPTPAPGSHRAGFSRTAVGGRCCADPAIALPRTGSCTSDLTDRHGPKPTRHLGLHFRRSVRSKPQVARSGPSAVCLMARPSLRACSARSPARLTYACNASPMAGLDRLGLEIATTIGRERILPSGTPLCEGGVPDSFVSPGRGHGGRPRGGRGRPSRCGLPVFGRRAPDWTRNEWGSRGQGESGSKGESGSGGVGVRLCVRREKVWVFSGCNSHPATGLVCSPRTGPPEMGVAR